MPWKLLKWWMERVTSSWCVATYTRGSIICVAACLLLALRVNEIGRVAGKYLLRGGKDGGGDSWLKPWNMHVVWSPHLFSHVLFVLPSLPLSLI